MHYNNFLLDEVETISQLKIAIRNFFWWNKLVINDVRSSIKKEVLPHIEFVGTYDQRIIGILENTTMILAEPFHEEIITYYNKFWLCENVNIITIPNQHHLTLSEIIIENKNIKEKIQTWWFSKIIWFLPDEWLEKLSSELGIPLINTQEVSEKANNKKLLKKYLLSQNLPTISWIFTADSEIIKQYYDSEKTYLFKMPQGVSWYWFWNNKKDSLEDILAWYQGNEIIIEEMIEKKGSPSIQFFIGEDWEKIIFWFTDQILEDEQIYNGNTSPSIFLSHKQIKDSIILQSESIIEYIRKTGYLGFWWIDFIINSNNEVFATEVNARFTAATFPSLLTSYLKETLIHPREFHIADDISYDHKHALDIVCIQHKDHAWSFPVSIGALNNWNKFQYIKIK